MNMIFTRRLSALLSCTMLAVVSNGLSAQAQIIDTDNIEGSAKASPGSSRPTIPGTTATSASYLTNVESSTPQSAKQSGNMAVPRVAQVDGTNQPSPGFETAPTPTETAPTPTTPTSPGFETTPAPTTPTSPGFETAPTPTTPEQTAPAAPAANFIDVTTDYWAEPFIQALAARNAIAGFPDGAFRPEQPVTRAEFAAMIQRAFNPAPVQQLSPTGFTDVPPDYWAAPAIRSAYEAGFMAGYPDNTFMPNQEIPKVQAITALANGLGLTATGDPEQILTNYYADAGQVPSYAFNQVAAATEANVVVNYPDVRTLNPQVPLTRAEAAAHLYQALVRLGQVQPLPATVAAAGYIVGPPPQVTQVPPTTPEPTPEETTPPETLDVEPGRATRGGASYIGVGANFGLSGASDLGDGTNLAVFSKIGLLRSFSVRPAVVVGDNTTVLIPITYDFSFRTAETLEQTFSIAPYVGAGVGIATGGDEDDDNGGDDDDGSDVGLLLTAGVDVPLSPQFTATAAVNANFRDDTDVGIWVGVGYNFAGF